MRLLLLPLCLLVACGTVAREASSGPTQESAPQTLQEALDLLPLQVFGQGHDPQTPGAPLNFLQGVGSVTAQEVVDAVGRAGITLRPDQVNIIGAPAVPPALPPGSPIRAQLTAPETGRGGERYGVVVRLTNLTAQALDGSYGAATLDAVIEDSSGKAVFWATPGLVPAIAFPIRCAPLGTCDQELKLNFSLDRFQPRLPLKAGGYTLRVFVTRLTLGEQALNFGLPPQSLTVLP